MTTAEAERQTLVAIRPGMFHVPAHDRDVIHLLGTCCGGCGETFFPPRHFCAACSSGDMREIELDSRGTVQTFTIVHQQLNGSVMVPPYAIVRVALENGPTVQTVMASEDAATVAIGDAVETVAIPITTDKDGSTIVSFAARPVGAKSAGG